MIWTEAAAIPCYRKRTCGHVCAVNSKALEMAGVTADTPDPEEAK